MRPFSNRSSYKQTPRVCSGEVLGICDGYIGMILKNSQTDAGVERKNQNADSPKALAAGSMRFSKKICNWDNLGSSMA